MLSAAPGVELGLDELLEMRHRLHEARLFSRRTAAARWSACITRACADAAWTSTRCASTSPATTYGPSTGASPRAPASRTPLFHEERERPVFVLVEQSQRLFFGSGLCFKAVLAARAAAFIGWSALAHNDRIGGLVFSDRDCHEISRDAASTACCNCSTSYCGPIASCARRRPSGLANCSAWPCAAPAKCCARAA